MSAIRKFGRSLSFGGGKKLKKEDVKSLQTRFPNHREAFFKAYYKEFMGKFKNGVISPEHLKKLLSHVFHSILTNEIIEEMVVDTFDRCHVAQGEGIDYMALMKTAHSICPECNTPDFKPLMTFIMSDFNGDGVVDVKEMVAVLSRTGDIYEMGWNNFPPIEELVELFVQYGEIDATHMPIDRFINATYDPRNSKRHPRLFDTSLTRSFFNTGTDVTTTMLMAVVMMAFVEANKYTMFCTNRFYFFRKPEHSVSGDITYMESEEECAKMEDKETSTVKAEEQDVPCPRHLKELLNIVKESKLNLRKFGTTLVHLDAIASGLEETRSTLEDETPNLARADLILKKISEKVTSVQAEVSNAFDRTFAKTATLSTFLGDELAEETLEEGGPISQDYWEKLLKKHGQKSLMENTTIQSVTTLPSLHASSSVGNLKDVDKKVEGLLGSFELNKPLSASTSSVYGTESFNTLFKKSTLQLDALLFIEADELPENVLQTIRESTAHAFDPEYLADRSAEFRKFAGGHRLQHGRVIHLLQKVYPECNSQEVTEKLVRFCGGEGGAVDFPSLFIAMCKLAPESMDLPLKALLTFDMCDVNGNGEMELNETLRILSAAGMKDEKMAKKVANNMKYLFEKVGEDRIAITRDEFLTVVYKALPIDAESRLDLHTGIDAITTGVLAIANHVRNEHL